MPDHDRFVALGLLASKVNKGAPSGRLVNVKPVNASFQYCSATAPTTWRNRIRKLGDPRLFVQPICRESINRRRTGKESTLTTHSPTPESTSYIHSIYIMSSSDGPFADWYEIIVWGCDWLSSQIPPEPSTSAATVPPTPTPVADNVASLIPPATDSEVSLSYC